MSRAKTLLSLFIHIFQYLIQVKDCLPGWHINCVYFSVITSQDNPVNKAFKILIADRNRNVRTLLQRELFGEGYQVILAGGERELIQLLQDEDAADLLILDPDLPSYLTRFELIELLHLIKPALPIVIYTFLNDEVNYQDISGVAACLEKKEDIGLLKHIIFDIIKNNCSKYSIMK